MTDSQNASTRTPASFEQALANSVTIGVEVRCLMDDGDSETEHEHSTTELILNFSDTFGAVIWRNPAGETRTETIDVNHCCVIPAGVRHLVGGVRPPGLVSLLVGGVMLGELMRGNVSLVMVENLRKITAGDALASNLITEFSRMLGRHPHIALVNAVAMILAVKLLQALVYRENRYKSKVPAMSPSEKQRTHDYVLSHLNGRINVSVLARYMGMSRTYFTRRFHAAFGIPPVQYALKLRVDKAIELLRTGDYRVSEAAYAAGFFDQSHLDRHCRKFYGRSPSTLLHP